MSEKYSYEIEVKGNILYVWDDLPTDELIEIAKFYKSLGYTEACVGDQNSTLCLCKPSLKEKKDHTSRCC